MAKVQRTVLIVDDVKEDRLIIRRALRQDPNIDYRFLEAENSAQALACLHQQPDCLLLDYHLPDLDGVQLLQKVVQQAAPHIYPVVMLTGDNSTAVTVQAMQAGAHDFLAKHALAAEQLQRAVNNAIEKVALQNELEAQQERFRLTLASIGDGVIATDRQGCITFMNPVAEALTGWTSGEAQGQPLAQVFSALEETTSQSVANPVSQVLRASQFVNQSNVLLVRRGGRTVPVDYNAAPIQDRLGQLRGVVLTFRDVSERKAASAALRASEERLRLASVTTGLGIWEVDLRSNQLYWSPELKALYGLPPDDALTPERIRQLVHPEDRVRVLTEQRQVWQTGQDQAFTLEHRIVQPDGSMRWVEARGQVFFTEVDGQRQPVRSIGTTLDITARKQAEAQLRFHASLLDYAHDAVIATDAQRRITAWNRGAEQMFGWRADEVLGRPSDEAISAAFSDEQRRQALHALTTTGVYRTEVTLHHRDGTPVMVDGLNVALHDDTGQLTGYLAINRDITERKVAEERLRESEARFRAIADYTYDWESWIGPDGRPLWINPAVERMTGWTADECLQMPDYPLALIHPADRTSIAAHLQSALAGSTANDVPFRIRHRAEHEVWAAISWQPILSQGVVQGYRSSVRDITERKQTEEALRRSEAHFHSLFASMTQGVVYHDAQGQIIEANPAAERILGLSMAQMQGRVSVDPRWRAIRADGSPFPGEEHPAMVALRTGQIVQGVVMGVFNPLLDEERWLLVDAVPQFHAGEAQPYQVYALFNDFTERKGAEEQLRESEARLRLGSAVAGLAIAEVDYTTNLIHLSLEAATLFGLPADMGTTARTTVHARFHPDDRAEIFQRIDAALDPTGLGWFAMEHRIVRPDGATRWLSVRKQIFFEPGEEGQIRPIRALLAAFDITERKQAEEALRQSEERFRTLANTVPSIIWTAAPDGTITYANDQWFHYCGLTPEENAQSWPQQVLHPDDFDRCVTQWSDALESGEEYAIEVRNRRYDGVYRWFITRATPLRDAEGRVTSWFGSTTDIDDRKRGEQNQQFLSTLSGALNLLTNPEQILRTVLERLGEYLGASRCRFNAIDLAGDQATLLAAWSQLGLPPPADLRPLSHHASPTYLAAAKAGRTFVVCDAAAEIAAEADAEPAKVFLLAQGFPAAIRVPCLRHGEWVASLHVLQNAPRQWRADEVQLVESVVHHFWPLVEKARAEEALRRQEAFVRQIADNVPGLVGYLGVDERYRFVNAGFEAWFQRPRQQIIGHTVLELLGAEERARLSPYRQQALAGETVTYEEDFTYPDGVTRSIWGRYQPDIGVAGAVQGLYIFVMDISERKRAEAALQQSNAILSSVLESSNDAIFVRDLEERYLLVNTAAAEQVNMPKATLIGQRYSELFSPVEVETIRNDDQPVLEQGQTVSLEHTTTHHNVTRYWHTLKMPLRNADGDVIGLVSSARDITERKRAELHQQFLSALFIQLRLASDADAMLEQMVTRLGRHLGVSSCRINQIDQANERFTVQKNWGGNGVVSGAVYPLAELAPAAILTELRAGRTVVVANTESDARTVPVVENYRQDEITSFIGVPIFYQGEWQATLSVRGAGERFWRPDEVALLETVAQQFSASLEKVRAEEALRASEERLRLALQAGNMAAFEYSLATNIIQRSPNAQIMQGLGERGVGGEYYDHVYPAERQELRRRIEAITPQQPSYEYEYRFRRPDNGQVIWLLDRGLGFFDEQGQLQRLTGMVLDISERKRREAEGRFLAELGEATVHIQDPDDLLWTVAQRLGEFLGVARCFFMELDAGQVIIHRNYHQAGLASLTGVYPLADSDPHHVAEQTAGRTLIIHDTQTDLTTAPRYTTRYTPLQARATVMTPLLRNGQWVATLAVNDQRPRPWTDGEVALIQTVAERTWLAVENRRLFQETKTLLAQLEAMLDNAPVGFAFFDHAQRFVRINPALAALNRLPVAAHLNRPLAEILPQVARGALPLIKQVFATGEGVYNMELSGPLPTDPPTTGHALASYYPIRVGGETRFVGCTVLDITERKQAELALRESERRFRELADAMPQLVWRNDHTGRVEYLNQQWLDYTGLTLAESLQDMNQVVHPDDWATTDAAWRQALAAGAIYEAETRLRRQDGVYCWFLSRTVPVRNEAGAIINWYGTATDITARKQAEEALAAREAFVRAITDAVPNLIGYIDQHKRYRFVNATYAQWFARPRHQIEGGTMQNLLGEQLNAWRRHWDRALAGETVNFEETFTYPDGVTRTIMGTYIPDRGADGQVLGFYLYINDITARKQAEAAVVARETELRVITDNIPGLISYVDNEQCYRFANAVYEQWYNRPRRQIVGQHVRTALGEAVYPQVQPYIERTLQGELVQFEATLPYPSGVRTVWATYLPNVDAQGVVYGFYALVTDISERKRAEEQLRASEERLRLALEGGGMGIWEWEISTDVSTWTEQEYALFGLAPGAPITHERFASLIHPEDRGEMLAALDKLVQQGGDYKGEYRVIHPDGQVRWLAERCQAICNPEGEPVRLLGVNFDITERKQAEETLRQFNKELDRQVQERTAELTKRLHELDQFAYVASHDLKSPLRAIDHLAHWINDDAAHLLPPTSRGHLEKMQGRITRMEKLLDDLLAYSRADRYEYKVEKVDLAQLLDDIIRLVTPPQGFAVNTQTSLPGLVTQKVPLETVLRNLINNAIKHHNRSDGQVQVAVQDLGEFLEFSVSDDGPGIPLEYHERIFQLFQTLKPRDQVEGSGMGLAIVKKIVESRGGAITVKSSMGQGATFRFTWPKIIQVDQTKAISKN
ncbi:MAG: PAS domain S-box protein [Caldilineaceae bacterium]